MKGIFSCCSLREGGRKELSCSSPSRNPELREQLGCSAAGGGWLGWEGRLALKVPHTLKRLLALLRLPWHEGENINNTYKSLLP